MAELTDDDIEKLVDQRCDDFEGAWSSGDRPEIGDAVRSAPAAAREALFGELIALELELRTRTGELPQIDRYLGQYPDRAEAIHRAFGEFQTWAQSTSAIDESLKPGIASRDQDTARGSLDTPTSPDREPADTKTLVRDATPPSGLPPAGPDSRLGRGTRLGTYELVSLLGQGGMGTVYRARHTRLGRTVALKVLLPGLLSHGEAVTRFESEIRALGPLDHRNVVHAVDADESGGSYYYVMDFVPGVDLARMSKHLGPLPAADACELIRQAAEGLEYLHENGIVHRDLKPANLMVCAGLSEHGVAECSRQKACCEWAPLVKILDMGLARLRQWREENEPITSTGQMLGTIDFMAPEQLDDSHDVDIRADIYSLGATLYQLLTGRPPYPSSSRLHKLKALATESPPSVGSLRPDLPEPLVAAVDRMLQRGVADRFQTPGQVAEALSPFTEGADLRALARQVPRRDEPLPLISSEVEPGPLIPVDDRRGPSADCAPSNTSPKRQRGTVKALPSLARRASVVRAVAALLVVALVAIAVMVVRVRTPYGEVIVQAAEGTGVEIEVQQNGKQVDVIGPQDGWRVRVAEGKYNLVLRSADRELSLNKDTVTVSRNGKAEVKIVRRSPQPAEVATDTSPLLPPQPVPSKRSTGEFYDSGQELDGAGTHTAAVGDLDGDGDLDVVLANLLGPSHVWLNDGAGRFENHQQLTSDGVLDVALGDLDGDGDWDAAFTGRSSSNLGSIWLNDGEGRFTDTGWKLPGDRSWRIVLADLDSDADLDAVVANESGPNCVFRNDGKGHLLDSGQRLGNFASKGLGVGDLDGDSDSDIFVCNYFEQPNRVWLNDGRGNFSDSGQVLGAARSHDVALADIDGDSDLDAYVVNADTPDALWTNDGTGRFSLTTPFSHVFASLAIDMADLDGNGRTDYFIANGFRGKPEPSQVLLAMDDGEGFDAHWSQPSAATDVALADFDGDGDIDAFVANLNDHPNRVWFNRDIDQPVASPWSFEFRDSGQELGSASSLCVELGDLDGDGDLDAVVANGGSDPNRIWWNDGHGQFRESEQALGSDALHDLAVGDLDNDDDLDVFLACKDGPNTVWLNDGKGDFTVTEQQIGQSSSAQVALADFDGDGDLDAWVGNFNPHHDRVWINGGSARFADSGQTLGKERNWAVHTGDVDGDGDVDVLVGTAVSAPNSLWLNDGRGVFTKSDEVLSGTTGSNGFAVGDLNGDGAVDLFETYTSGSDRVWLNDGAGRFTETGQELPSLLSKRAQLADLDGDGDLDVVVSGERGLPNYALLNDGSGQFEDRVQWFGNSSSSGLALGDLDGDGDLDVFVANYHEQPNRVWLNQRVGETPDQPQVSESVQTADSGDSGGDADDREGTPVDDGDVLAGATIAVSTNADILDGDISSIENLIGRPGDDGAISLREAIIAANNTAGDDTIDVSVKGAITLSIAGTDEDAAATGDLDIRSSITIQGNGARSTIIDGGGIDRVFEIAASDITVCFNDLTIRGGAARCGGGIQIGDKNSTTNLTRVRITGNQGVENGAGLNVGGIAATTVNIRDSLFDNNTSTGGGGALVVFPAGTVSLANTTISANVGYDAGGIVAQFNDGGSLAIVNSTITGNRSTFPTAGGIQKNNYLGTITLTNSIVAGNSGDQFKGQAGGVIDSGGNNIVGPGSGTFRALESDLEFDRAIDALLHPLADNGGPTDTHALVAGGIALDAGSNTAAEGAGLSTDQRGTGSDRIINGSVDIGAFEFVPPRAETTTSESTAPQEP